MRRLLRALRSAEDGNVLVTVALALPLLVGSAGLAVDTIQWTWSKRNLQAAADAAATAGVYAAIQGDSVEDAVAQALARSGDTGVGTNVQVVRFPKGHEGDSLAVEVRLAAPAALSFTGMFLSSRPSIG